MADEILSPKRKMATLCLSAWRSKCTSNQFNIPKSATKFQFRVVVWIWPLLPAHCYIKTGATNEGLRTCHPKFCKHPWISLLLHFNLLCVWGSHSQLFVVAKMVNTCETVCESTKKPQKCICKWITKNLLLTKHICFCQFFAEMPQKCCVPNPNFFSCSSSFSQQLHQWAHEYIGYRKQLTSNTSSKRPTIWTKAREYSILDNAGTIIRSEEIWNLPRKCMCRLVLCKTVFRSSWSISCNAFRTANSLLERNDCVASLNFRSCRKMFP